MNQWRNRHFLRISKSTSPSGSKSGRDKVDDGNSPVASRLFVLNRSASGFNSFDFLNKIFWAIYEKYRDILLTVAMSLLADPELAQDVVQDVFRCEF